jgi:hypothetical protein
MWWKQQQNWVTHNGLSKVKFIQKKNKPKYDLLSLKLVDLK